MIEAFPMETLRTCFCFNRSLPETCSRSTRHQDEIEARNVCQWLCVSGFPQYVQMFRGNCGPINLTQVEKDHQFLDEMSLKLLLSQISFLNQLSSQKIFFALSKEEFSAGSDDEDNHALSDQWTRQMDGGRLWVHKFLPQNRITSSHRKLSCSNSYDSALPDIQKISKAKPISRCLSSGPSAPTGHCSSGGPAPVGPVKIRSSSLSGKGVKKSSFFSRDRSLTPLSRGSSVSDSEQSSEGSPMSASWSGGDQSKFRSSFRNMFRRGESQRSRKSTGNHSRPPNTPSSGRLDIGCPVFISTPETEEKMEKLRCLDVNSAAIQALATDGAKSEDVPVISTVSNNNFSSACESGCSDRCLLIDSCQCDTADDMHRCQDVSDSVKNDLGDSTEGNNGLTENSESVFPITRPVGNSLFVRNDLKLYSFSPKIKENGLIVEKKVKDHCADDRLSIYDNVPASFEDNGRLDTQMELDLILADIYRDINSLNETLKGVEGVEDACSEDADSNSVFEEVSSSCVYSLVLLSPQNNRVSELDVPIANDTTNSCQNNSRCRSKSDFTHDNYHRQNTSETISTLHLGKAVEDIPISFLDWNNEVKYPSVVIPNSENYVTNIGDNSTGRTKDASNNIKENSMRLDTLQQTPRWESFSRDHRLSSKVEYCNLSCVTACQMTLLCKLNLVKLTSILEKFVPSIPLSWFWSKSRHVNNYIQYSGVFGRPLLRNLQEIGCSLPSWVIYAMQRIRGSAAEAVGIFRKSGVRSRIQQFRDQIQSDSESVNFDSLQIYDIADLLKLYFRELPECLLTRPLSQIFISIFRNVPKDLWLEAIRAGIVLMPDENREVLQCLLFLLKDLSEHASENQMTASNLAICFAPSLFHVYEMPENSPKLSANRSKHRGVKRGGEGGGGGGANVGSQKLTPPISEDELQEQQAAQECLTFMISNSKDLFSVSKDLLEQCSILRFDRLPFIHPFDKSSLEIYKTHLQQMIGDILQENSENFRSWSSLECVGDIELSYKKLEHPLRLWRCCAEVNGSPQDVLAQILERRAWDRDVTDESVIDRLGTNMDVCHYAFARMPPQLPQSFCVLRLWDTLLPNDACILVSTSVKHTAHESASGTVFTSSYLIESCRKEKSRVIFISQVDLSGYSPQWYRKAYGYLCVNLMTKLRDYLNAHRQTKV